MQRLVPGSGLLGAPSPKQDAPAEGYRGGGDGPQRCAGDQPLSELAAPSAAPPEESAQVGVSDSGPIHTRGPSGVPRDERTWGFPAQGADPRRREAPETQGLGCPPPNRTRPPA
jgi:hypothetical protein